MPYDGSGNFNRVHDWTADEGAGIKVRADRFDAENDDFATAFENCITRDGQGKPSANIDFNNKKITNLADATLLQDAVNIRTSQQNAYSFGTTAGSANTYTLALGVTVASLVDGQPFRAEINVTNTSSSTLNVDSIGAKTIKADGQDLTGGELQANSIYCFAYNQGQDVIDLIKPANATETLKGIVELATSAETVAGTDTTRATHPAGVEAAIAGSLSAFGGINGLKMENDSGDTQHDIKVNNGICVDSTKTIIMDFTSSTIIKRIDASWAEGTNQGGFPTGISLSANTSYAFYLIAKTDGTIDAGFDSALDASNLLADATAYTYYRRIGSVQTDASSNIYNFNQVGDLFSYKTVIKDFDGASGTGNQNRTLTVPNGVQVLANVIFYQLNASDVVFLDPNQTKLDSFHRDDIANASKDATTRVCNLLTNTSRQVVSNHTSSTTFKLYTVSYIDFRGKNDLG